METPQGWSPDRADIVQKVTRRLIPFVGIAYLIAYIDRQNVSYAKLQIVGAANRHGVRGISRRREGETLDGEILAERGVQIGAATRRAEDDVRRRGRIDVRGCAGGIGGPIRGR